MAVPITRISSAYVNVVKFVYVYILEFALFRKKQI